MTTFRILSVSEQIAAHLRDEIARGRWNRLMPGRIELAKRFDVGISSMEEALRQLESEGLIIEQGIGRPRRIADGNRRFEKRRLRIAILAYENSTSGTGIFSEVAHVLREAGHDAFFTNTSLVEMNFNLKRIANHVNQTECDAWIACSAPREVTQWFASGSKPALSLFGRRRGVPIASAGPDKSSAIAAGTERLIKLGHRRIVLLVRRERILPVPGTPERAFLAALAAHGVTPGSYHLPEWEDTMEGFQDRLESLFQMTPPTALIVDEMMLFVATLQFLSRNRLSVPEDVSLMGIESDPAFAWCRPSIAQVVWDKQPVLRRVVAWAKNVANGKKDIRETNTSAKFIDGGSVGPARQTMSRKNR